MCLWAEATMAAVYVQNRLSHSALGLKTPEEMFTGKKPEVSHLKIFGCPVFIHIPKEKRNKLDPSRKKGIFVGYCEVSKAFRIYIPGQHHIDISRDVTFDEDSVLKKSKTCHLEEVYEEEPIIPLRSNLSLECDPKLRKCGSRTTRLRSQIKTTSPTLKWVSKVDFIFGNIKFYFSTHNPTSFKLRPGM